MELTHRDSIGLVVYADWLSQNGDPKGGILQEAINDHRTFEPSYGDGDGYRDGYGDGYGDGDGDGYGDGYGDGSGSGYGDGSGSGYGYGSGSGDGDGDGSGEE